MRQLIAGNWKMNTTTAEATALATTVRHFGDLNCDLLVCPPATQIAAVAATLAHSDVAVGGQDCHWEPCGAYTGDIAAPMLHDAGARWVILGHSERRTGHGETDEMVYRKAQAAAAAGLTSIICVGESREQRSGGHETTIIGEQLTASLPDSFAGVVAYEPLWAIGTGVSATEADVEAMHAFIRQRLVARFGKHGAGLRVLYGGSVKPSNASALLALPDVGGALVGGASLLAGEFLAIARAATTIV